MTAALAPPPTPALLAARPRARLTVVSPPPTPQARPAGRRWIVWAGCPIDGHDWAVTPVGVVCRHCPVHARPTTHRSGQ